MYNSIYSYMYNFILIMTRKFCLMSTASFCLRVYISIGINIHPYTHKCIYRIRKFSSFPNTLNTYESTYNQHRMIVYMVKWPL